jgi:hypothetical protein
MRNPWYSFSEAESTSGHMVLSEGTTEKIPSDTTGDRSRDRPTSSAATNRIYENQRFVAVACFLPGRVKDLSVPLYFISADKWGT